MGLMLDECPYSQDEHDDAVNGMVSILVLLLVACIVILSLITICTSVIGFVTALF